MKRLLIALLLTALTAQAEPFWFSGRQQDWEANKNKGLMRAVELINYQTTNSILTTNGTIYVTNYVHTAENTNNVLWQINFGFTNKIGDNVWIMGYDSRKCGGFGLTAQWAELDSFCKKNKKFQCGWGMGLTEYMAINNYGALTNQWLTLDIPFVDDGQKMYKRDSQYKKKKK